MGAIAGLRAFSNVDGSGRIPVTRFGFAALRVPDPTTSAQFYVDAIGLAVTSESDGSVHLTCDDWFQSVVLLQGDEPELDHVGLEIGVDLDTATSMLEDLGIQVERGAEDVAAANGLDGFIDAIGPEQVRYRLFNVMRRRGFRPEPGFVQIAQLGHIGVYFDDLAAAFDFHTNVFDLRVSDYIGERTVFMRCNPLHHSVVIAQKQREGRLNHVNFMVTEIDDIGKALHRFEAMNVPVVFGPGRHPTSTSVFLYFLTPDGFTHEYSFGMAEIFDDEQHRPRVFDPVPSSICSWGSRPKPEAF